MIQTRISVRALIEFILRSGDIDNRIGISSDNAMIEGTRIHKQLQKAAGADYTPEVPLSYAYTEEDVEITVEGRADGIIENVMGVTVDEIKSTYADVMHYREAQPLHLAQAKFYAYIISEQKGLPTVNIRMTYVNIDTEEVKYFHYTFMKDELLAFTSEVCHAYVKWARFEAQWHDKRNESIKGLPFPFEYRQGQGDLVKQVYYTISKKKKLFLEAPTGVGKTISTIYPSVMALGQDLSSKIFYLTAKTITRTVADETVDILRGKGLSAKSIIITAKEKICMTGKNECNPDACPYAKGHYDRINDAVFAMLTEKDSYTRDTVYEYAERFQVCPFEMSLDVSLFTDIIICDYNYAFDPRAKLKRFFEEGSDGNFIFLIDEAHNLVDRAREMFSAVLVKEKFMELRRLTEEAIPLVSKRFEKCNKAMLELKHQCQKEIVCPDLIPLHESVRRLYSSIDGFLEEERKTEPSKRLPAEIKDPLLEQYFELGHFLNISEIMDEDYTPYATYDDEGNFYVKLFCVNPRNNLKECMKMARASVLFSATFLPIRYYMNLLAGDSDDYAVYAKSVFDPNKRGLFIANDVTSKYTRRSDEEFVRIAAYIREVTMQKAGNYMVFFPSYGFLEKVCDAYEQNFSDDPNVEVLVQSSGMKEEEREAFLSRFKGNDENVFGGLDMDIEEEDSTLIGFCVMGGIFSEGIDLKHDSLIGAIIVGTGLPQVCLEREIMKETFDTSDSDGFDYAYRFPGMNKVLQAAGRVIRTREDVGIVVLLDERFLQNSYKKLYPREWEEFEPVSIDKVAYRVERFWDQWL